MTETRGDPARRPPAAPVRAVAPAPVSSRDIHGAHHVQGSRTLPVRYASQVRAAARPSAIAQTISDAPRTASPAAKTPGVAQAHASSTATLPELSKGTESPSSSVDRVAPS